MKAKSIAFLGILLLPFALTHTVVAETRDLTWDAVTTYTDGSPIEDGKTVMYTACWSNDPWLAADTLRTLVSSATATSVAFDPAAQEMVGYETIYFTVKSVLSTGEESAQSAALPWNPPAAVAGAPSAPAGLGITWIKTSGTWQLSWDPVTTYLTGASLQGTTPWYAIFWTTDPNLSAASLTPLAPPTTETSLTFDPAASGMAERERVYFAAKTVLDTGEESPLSESLSWKVSNTGPGAPGNGRMVGKNKQ